VKRRISAIVITAFLLLGPGLTEVYADSFYTVKKGDTIYSLAQKYRTTSHDIIKWNNLTSSRITVGKRLIVTKSKKQPEYIIVKEGDTLYSIAKKHHLTVRQ
jgi:LysM repeat protein